jgi:hypothetical protein
MDKYEKLVELETVIQSKIEESEVLKQQMLDILATELQAVYVNPTTVTSVSTSETTDDLQIYIGWDDRPKDEKLTISFSRDYNKNLYTLKSEHAIYLMTSFISIKTSSPSTIDYVRIMSYFTERLLEKGTFYTELATAHELFMRKLVEIEDAKSDMKSYKDRLDKDRTHVLSEQLLKTISVSDKYMLGGHEHVITKITEKLVFTEFWNPTAGYFGGRGYGEHQRSRIQKDDFAKRVLRSLPERVKKIIEVTETISSSVAINRLPKECES